MTDKERTVAQQDSHEKKAQPDGIKKTPAKPKLIIKLEELEGTSAGAVCDVTTGQCTE